MILISHRGNINGPIPEKENHPDYIDQAIVLGYDVEIDLWSIEGVILLGHDKPQYGISQHWLNERHDKLWVHCKNIQAVEWFNMIKGFNYFWHEVDTMTLTSFGHIWAYPGKQPIKNSIAVMPEINNDSITVCKGMCSDYIQRYK
jgi:hypothetical protein